MDEPVDTMLVVLVVVVAVCDVVVGGVAVVVREDGLRVFSL